MFGLVVLAGAYESLVEFVFRFKSYEEPLNKLQLNCLAG